MSTFYLPPTWCIVCLDKNSYWLFKLANIAEEETDDNKETWVEAVQDGGDDEEDGGGEDGRDGVHNRVTPWYQNYFSPTNYCY